MGVLKDEDITPLLVVSVPFLGGLVALGMITLLLGRVRQAKAGTGPQIFIADQIATGATSFLVTEYTYLAPFVVACAVFIVGVLEGQKESPVEWSKHKGGWQTMLCFLCGAALSAAAGWAGGEPPQRRPPLPPPPLSSRSLPPHVLNFLFFKVESQHQSHRRR